MGALRIRRWLVPALLVAVAGAIQLTGLERAPRYLAHDEIIYSLNGESLAATGLDLNGRAMPMYIEYPARFGRPTWDQPMLIYALAATLKVLPVSEFAIRLPMAIAAIVDVLLIYAIGRMVFRSEWIAVAAAILLAVTPAHMMHGRMATDFQLWVPFELAWMWCLLRYLREPRPQVLLLSGAMLGVGMYGYVAAYLFVPMSAAITIAILLQRREGLRPYGWFLAGIALPTLICLPWMLRSPVPFRDILAHYAVVGPSGDQPAVAGLDQNIWRRIAEIPALYASFWDPRFLFVDGPIRSRGAQLVGVFLLPVAGLIAIGLVRTVTRHSRDDLLILAGFLTAALPASLAGEAQAIWRALPLAPFGALLAAVGLQELCTSTPSDRRRFSFVAAFALVAAIGAGYHDVLIHAQAWVRAATAPLAVLGLATLFQRRSLERVSIGRIAMVTAAALLAMHGAYVVANYATIVAVALLILISAAALLTQAPDWLGSRPLVGVALVALVVGHFMFVYVELIPLHRVGPLPASLLILALRLAVSFVTAAAIVAFARSASRFNAAKERHLGTIAAILLVCIQLSYFAIDSIADYRWRFVQAAIVLVAAFGLALFLGARSEGRRFAGRIALAGLAGLIAVHFSWFVNDYFTGFQVRNSVDQEGNARIAFERVIDRSAHREVPRIFLGRIGPYAGGDLYWKFYLLKHHREDLLARTIPALDFPPDRIRALPAGSIVISSPAADVDAAIDEMSRRGELQAKELLKAPDGSPIFWILETRAR